jgi:hypothetical protein
MTRFLRLILVAPKISQHLFASDLYRHKLAFAFAALSEPGTQTFRKAFRSQAEAGFDLSISDGKGVVKVGGVGEVAHAELVEPIERARTGFASNYHVDREFLCVHGQNGWGKPHPHSLKQGEPGRGLRVYEVRGRFTEWARPTASSIQMKYQPMSV